MTDVQAPEFSDGTAQEANEPIAPRYAVGDYATISKGTHRGHEATVIAVDLENATYAVKVDDGALVVIKFGNLRRPVEATASRTLSSKTLAGMIRGADDLTELVTALIERFPNFAKVWGEGN